MQVKINSKNEAVTLDSLKDFYISEIGKAGTAYGISKQLGKSHRTTCQHGRTFESQQKRLLLVRSCLKCRQC
jgi:PHP family Zn ribbon phosphoesterase